MKKKIKNEKKVVILLVLFALIIMATGCQLDNRTLNAVVNDADKTVPGTVWMELADPISPAYGTFVVEVHCNSGTQNVAAYGFNISFDLNYLSVKLMDDGKTPKVEVGPDGFLPVAAVTGNTLNVSGFDVTGKGPSMNLHMLNITFKYSNFDNLYNKGTTMTLNVDNLTDSNTDAIPNAQGSSLKIGQ